MLCKDCSGVTYSMEHLRVPLFPPSPAFLHLLKDLTLQVFLFCFCAGYGRSFMMWAARTCPRSRGAVEVALFFCFTLNTCISLGQLLLSEEVIGWLGLIQSIQDYHWLLCCLFFFLCLSLCQPACPSQSLYLPGVSGLSALLLLVPACCHAACLLLPHAFPFCSLHFRHRLLPTLSIPFDKLARFYLCGARVTPL